MHNNNLDKEKYIFDVEIEYKIIKIKRTLQGPNAFEIISAKFQFRF